MKLNLEKACNKSEECRRNPRINWGYSSIEQRGKYCDSLDRKLSSIEYSSPCQNILCSNYSHHQNLDQLTVGILESIMESAWDNLEHTSGTTGDQKSRKFTIPGWNILVKPFQEESKFWFNLWSSAGKPTRSTTPGVEHELYSIMRYSRNQFHYAVRRAQKNINLAQNDKLLKKMGQPDFFKELKNLCKQKNDTVSSVVDRTSGAAS